MQIFFWISFFLVFYTYVGYGLLLVFINAIFKRSHLTNKEFTPAVTIIIPAYNEENIIQEKLANTLQLDYPAAKIKFLFVTDGSTDRTAEIVQQYPQVTLLHKLPRLGKTAAINRAMKFVSTPFVFFSDANALLHPQSIRQMIRHFADEKVGGVSGEKRIAINHNSTVGFGERLYWQYESKLKKANADFYTLIGAAGELFAIRTALYEAVDERIILDDFVISTTVCSKGLRFLYEADAYAVEAASTSIEEERTRKIRISAGCFQALALTKGLLHPVNYPLVSFQYFSHRLMRWVVCPFLLPLLFASNCYLFLQSNYVVYHVLFWLQLTFYFLAIGGLLLPAERKSFRAMFIPSYFIFMVSSQYAGFYRFLTKKQTVLWEKASRNHFS